MSDLVVIVYPSEAKAEEVRQRLLSLRKEYLITINDVVIAVKGADGNVKLNQLVNTTAIGSRFGQFLGTFGRSGLLESVDRRGCRSSIGGARRSAIGLRHQRLLYEAAFGKDRCRVRSSVFAHQEYDSGQGAARSQGLRRNGPANVA